MSNIYCHGVNGLKETLAENGQEHLLKYWDSLSDNEKQQLHSELLKLNYSEINKYFKAAQESLNAEAQKIDDILEPCQVYSNQYYVIKFVRDLWQVSGFLHVLRFPPPIKLTAMILTKQNYKIVIVIKHRY
jgi:UDP-N-acetylglucosamine/UDP-N-acetylgalactosamine diphosphorylase